MGVGAVGVGVGRERKRDRQQNRERREGAGAAVRAATRSRLVVRATGPRDQPGARRSPERFGRLPGRRHGSPTRTLSSDGFWKVTRTAPPIDEVEACQPCPDVWPLTETIENGGDRERSRHVDLDAADLVAASAPADVLDVQCDGRRHAYARGEWRADEGPQARRQDELRNAADKQDGEDRAGRPRAATGLTRRAASTAAGTGCRRRLGGARRRRSRCPRRTPSTSVSSSWLPAASSSRRSASRSRAPCGTAGSWSSPRTRRRPRGSGRSAGCPRRPAGRDSRRRPSARGGGGCRPGPGRCRAGRGRSRRRARRAA